MGGDFPELRGIYEYDLKLNSSTSISAVNQVQHVGSTSLAPWNLVSKPRSVGNWDSPKESVSHRD